NGLRQLRFTDVLEGYDLGIEAMSTKLETFGARGEGADWAVIYYAGRGREGGGAPYLAPSDANLASASDPQRDAITLKRLLATPARVKQLRVVILDMPRANPFGSAAMPRFSTRVDPLPGEDVFLAFATQPGNVLAESSGSNGVYALALLSNMPTRG